MLVKIFIFWYLFVIFIPYIKQLFVFQYYLKLTCMSI
jgi:hypothetical protein